MEKELTIESLVIEVAALKAALSEANLKLSLLMEQISSHCRKLYGVSSEKTVYDNKNEQLTYLTNEPPELFIVHNVEQEPEIKTKDTHGVRPRKSSEMCTRIPAGMPVEIIECVLPDETFDNNGRLLHRIGREFVRRELKFTPAIATIIEIWRNSYTSRESERDDDKVSIIKAPLPPQVIKGSMCTPETIAHIIVQKCVMGAPLHRQAQDWKRKGIPIAKQTMANWLIRCSNDYFEPIYDELHIELLKNMLLHSDGTSFQVLKEPGKSPQSESCMWQFRTSGDAVHQIVLFDYKPDKRQIRPMEFLKGFSGYLTTDGSPSYNNLPDEIILTGCFSHARSHFSDALRCLKKDEQPGSLALIGKEFCDHVFDIERDIKDKSYDERYRIRNEKAAPHLSRFYDWLKSVEPYVVPKSKLGKAVGYCLNQWQYLTRYLLDGRIECSNNRAERSFKTFVVNRKNFLFADSVAGGRATAVLHSLTETAKEAKLDPYRYLTHVLQTAAGIDLRKNPTLVKMLLPENAPASCKVPD